MELIFKEQVYAVVGAAIEVHNTLGAGFLEAVYQEAMQIELADRGVPHIAQQPLRISYKNRQLQAGYKADIICNAAVLVEIKALDKYPAKRKAKS